MTEIETWVNKQHVLTILFDLKTLTLTGDELFDGALKTLKMFRKTGIIMGLVTSADTGWANRTYGHLNLRGQFDHFQTVASYGHIGLQDWKNVFDELGFWPQNGVVVGYGPQGDIHEIGLKYCVGVLRNGEMYRVRNRYEETRYIKSIAHVARALLAAV